MTMNHHFDSAHTRFCLANITIAIIANVDITLVNVIITVGYYSYFSTIAILATIPNLLLYMPPPICVCIYITLYRGAPRLCRHPLKSFLGT